ncbi:kelch-like protein 26 [Branchiostoma floridae x Branchiostoma japonicum]
MATSKGLGESDIATIFVDKKTFKVNKKTLVDNSDFFAAMFASGMKETTQNSAVLHDVSARVFRDLLVFMETGKLRCEIGEELLTAAAFLQMRGVIEHSIRHILWLRDDTHLNNACLVLAHTMMQTQKDRIFPALSISSMTSQNNGGQDASSRHPSVLTHAE